MMLTTNELRWFYRGTLPTEIAVWMAAHSLGDYLSTPESREDVYLYVPECDYLGIKLRQKRLEIKLRKAELGNMTFGDNLAGKLEKWVKWSCEDPTTESLLPPDLIKKAPWVSVQKVRQQRKYEINGDRTLKSVPMERNISQGCNLEITQLTIRDNAWWSLALEAFGKDDRLTKNLEITANWVFQNNGVLELQLQNSYAYPKWLSLVI